MSPSKPGRNEPCPCGSGKKYKACHASEERARASASSPRPLAQELQAAMALLGSEDSAPLSRALTTLESLLRQAGPSPALRFEPSAFDAHLTQDLATLGPLVRERPAQARRELIASTARALCSPAFLERLRAALLSLASSPSRASEERIALCTGALLASASPQALPEDNPLLEVLFDVQLQEWRARQQHSTESLEALVQQVQADPRLSQRVEQEARERSARVEARLREPATPPLLAPEEELWLTVRLWEPLRAVKHGEDAAARGAAVQRLLRTVKEALDEDFLSTLLGRLRQRARDTSLEEATRAFLADAAIALEAEPARTVLAILFTARQEAQGRSAEEMVALADLKAQTRWTPEDFEPYRQLLLHQGLPQAAARLERCQRWLREHPVQLAAEAP